MASAPPFHQLSCPQHGLFGRASAAVGKADNLNIPFHTFKRSLFFPDEGKVRCSRTVILRLHAPDDAQLHPSLLFWLKSPAESFRAAPP